MVHGSREGRIIHESSLRQVGVTASLADIDAAYASMMRIISLRLSTNGSITVIKAELSQILPRLRRALQESPASPTWGWSLAASWFAKRPKDYRDNPSPQVDQLAGQDAASSHFVVPADAIDATSRSASENKVKSKAFPRSANIVDPDLIGAPPDVKI